MATPGAGDKVLSLTDLSRVSPMDESVPRGWKNPATNSSVSSKDFKLMVEICRIGKASKLKSLIRGKNIINLKSGGRTLLHEACCHGNLKCAQVLMKAGACPTIWDRRGFTALHCAVYNGHFDCLKELLDFIPPSPSTRPKATAKELSRYDESLLHVACVREHVEIVGYLVRAEADLTGTDRAGNTVLHYAASSDNGALISWLLEACGGVQDGPSVDSPNELGQTPLHRACYLGNKAAVKALLEHSADTKTRDKNGYSPLQIAQFLGNMECFAMVKRGVIVQPSLPSHRKTSSIHRSQDALSSSQSLASSRGYQPQRSISNGSSNFTPPLQRQNSITGAPRPHTLSIVRRSTTDLRKGSLTSIDEPGMYLTKSAALQVRSSMKHRKSRSWDITQQTIYDSTAYDPPPYILFVPPIEKTKLSRDKSRFFSKSHDIKVRISPDHWPPQQPADSPRPDPEPTIELCTCAALHLDQNFPSGYTIVSPVYFISCKSDRSCRVDITLPHSVSFPDDRSKKQLCILSSTTVEPTLQSDVWSPGDRSLKEYQVEGLERESNRVRFRTTLVHPSLFAVAVNEKDHPLEPTLPLRCCLYVGYPVLESTARVSGLYLTIFIGVDLKTVNTAIDNQAAKDRSVYEKKHFVLEGAGIKVDAGLTNPSSEWVMTAIRDNAEFTYNQLSLSQVDQVDSYSHLPSYPPHTQFFIEPRGPASAVKCRVRVLDCNGKEMIYIKVIPFSPTRELTPPPSHMTSNTGHLTSQADHMTSNPSTLVTTV